MLLSVELKLEFGFTTFWKHFKFKNSTLLLFNRLNGLSFYMRTLFLILFQSYNNSYTTYKVLLKYSYKCEKNCLLWKSYEYYKYFIIVVTINCGFKDRFRVIFPIQSVLLLPLRDSYLFRRRISWPWFWKATRKAR